jgi:hypothetical protein
LALRDDDVSAAEGVPVHELKRFVPRQFADWNGTYLIDSDSTEHWRDCRVIDISSAGAGLELLDASSEVSVGQRIFVAVHLQGEIRHSTVRREGVLRVGTQFINLTNAERTYLESQERLAVHW